MMNEDKWLLRPAIVANKTERGFIMRTWLDTIKGSRESHDISSDVFYWHHHLLIESLWERDGSIWQCAVDPEHPSIIYGYICAEATDAGPMVHWCFVKSRFRGEGICQDMLREIVSRCPPGPLVFTANSYEWRGKFARKNGYIYNPYAKYYGLKTSWQNGANDGKTTRENKADDVQPEHSAAEDNEPNVAAP